MVWPCNFWQKNIGAKAACKMLMKLNTQDVFQTDSQSQDPDQSSSQIDLQTESESQESEHNINKSEFEITENVLLKIENPENLFEQGNKVLGILSLRLYTKLLLHIQ